MKNYLLNSLRNVLLVAAALNICVNMLSITPIPAPDNGSIYYVEYGETLEISFSSGISCTLADELKWKAEFFDGTTLLSQTVFNENIDAMGNFSCMIPADADLTNNQYTLRITYCNYSEVLNEEQVDYQIQIRRPGAHVMLVLDVSGSMLQPVISSSSTAQRWNVVRESVGHFLDLYRDWDETALIGSSIQVVVEDKIGVVYFNNTRTDYGSSPGLHQFNPADSPDHLGEINSTNTGIAPDGYTCIGGAIKAGYQAFNFSTSQLKHIIIFSDGLQNREPWVNIGTDGSGNVTSCTIQSDGTYPAGFDVAVPLADLYNNADKFKIHTVYTGDLAVGNFMYNLSKARSDENLRGESYGIINTDNIWDDYDSEFTSVFLRVLRDFSPAIVNKYSNIISGNVVTDTFTVNSSADRILIKVVGDNIARKVKVEIEKDGKSFSNFVNYNGSFIHFFAKKDTVEALGATMEGSWIVRVSGEKGTRFATTCIIDDEYIDYDCFLANQKPEPGDVLNLKVNVKAAGQPFAGLSLAKAWVLKPGQDINDLFANASLPVNIPKDWKNEPGNFAGQDKYEKLIALDTAFVNALELVSNEIALTDNNDGTYTGQFIGTEESGVYKIIFRLEGEDATTGRFQRYHMLSQVIDFGPADLESTTFQVNSKLISRSFLIKPVNKFGHLIGPNRLASITLTMGGKKLELTDNLDGTYTAKVPFFTLFKRNATVKLDIKSQQFADVKYKDIKGTSLVSDLLIDLGSIILILLIIIIIIRRILK